MSNDISEELRTRIDLIIAGRYRHTLPFDSIDDFFELIDLDEQNKATILMYADNEPFYKAWIKGYKSEHTEE